MVPDQRHLPPGGKVRLQFGLFELDTGSGRLQKGRTPVRVQEQPFKFLAVLARNAGRIVTREELQAVLWPGDTYVDFDAGLKTVVRKARQALGDDAENPRFIETVPRQGYRFIAPVMYLMPDGANSVATEPASQEVSGRPARGKLPLIAALAVAVLIAVGVGLWPRISTESPDAHPLTASPLTSFPGDEYDPTFSPGGSEVAFAWQGEKLDNSDIYVVGVDTGVVRRLTTDPARDEAPAWSPDGRWIAFLRDLRNIMIVRADGGLERKVGETCGAGLSWTPDSRELIAASCGPHDTVTIRAISIDSVKERTLTSPAERVAPFQPFAVSPDGKLLAYARAEPGRPAEPFPRTDYEQEVDLYVRPMEGGEARRVTAFRRSMRGWAWTPDSRELVFCSNLNGPYQLWRVRADGGTPRLVVGVGEDSGFPVLGFGRGSRASEVSLAFEQRQLTINLHRQEFSGETSGRATAVAAAKRILVSTRMDFCPNLARDGRLVFVSDRSGFDELWVAGATGGEPYRLTFFGPSGAHPGSPRWSPDGNQIAYMLRRGNRYDLDVISPQGGPSRCVLHGFEEECNPSWSGDGKWIYFSSAHGGASQIWKIAASDNAASMVQAVQVTKSGGSEAFESPDGNTLYYYKGRLPGELWRMPAAASDASSEVVVRQGVQEGWWAVTASGILYVDLSNITFRPGPASAPKSVMFVSFKTGRSTEVTTIASRLYHWLPNFTASADGRTVIWGQADFSNIDLMLSHGFR
jgi:Tol biopolymer transport system component/DNA-binding winged helix-turn-helix (wHTH) protein